MHQAEIGTWQWRPKQLMPAIILLILSGSHLIFNKMETHKLINKWIQKLETNTSRKQLSFGTKEKEEHNKTSIRNSTEEWLILEWVCTQLIINTCSWITTDWKRWWRLQKGRHIDQFWKRTCLHVWTCYVNKGYYNYTTNKACNAKWSNRHARRKILDQIVRKPELLFELILANSSKNMNYWLR